MKNNPLRLTNNKASISSVILLSALSGLLEVFALTLVVMLMQILTGENPSSTVTASSYYQLIMGGVGLKADITPMQLVPVIVVIIIFANIVKVVSTWVQLRVSWSIQAKTSTKLLSDYMGLKYVDLVSESPAEVTSKIFNETEYVCSGFVQPVIKFFSSAVVLIVTLIGLATLLVELNFGFIALFVLGATVLVLVVVRPLIRRGERRIGVTREKHALIGSVVNGMEIIVQTDTAEAFTNKFLATSQKFASMISVQGTVKTSPKPVIEVMALSALAGFALLQQDNIAQVGLLVGIVGALGYRILPYAVILITTLSDMAFYRSSYRKLVTSLEETERRPRRGKSACSVKDGLDGDCLIQMSDVLVSYESDFNSPGNKRARVSNGKTVAFNFEIPKNSITAIVGSSGAGKSTLARLIAGLQEANYGSVCFNKRFFEDDPSVRYVGPEPIFFGFGVINNIGYSDFIRNQPVDRERAVSALRKSGFEATELTKVLETTSSISMLEDLSSGQRQRVAIARALYDEPKLLILDEALGNLDDGALKIVFHTFAVWPENYVLLVTHDRRPLQYCDNIIDIRELQTIMA